MYLEFLDIDVSGVTGNVASVGAVGQSDETRFSPRSSPTVSHLPVSTGLGQDAGGLHAVIDALAADGHDAAGVRVPTGSVKADGERASGLHVRGHAGLTTDSGVAAHTDNLTGHSLAGASGAVVRRVRVVRLSGDPASLGDVVVGMLGPATRATVGGSVALHDLLRAEEVSDSEGAHGVTFDLLSGRERPTRSAIALVLHRSGVFSSPVNQTCSCV